MKRILLLATIISIVAACAGNDEKTTEEQGGSRIAAGGQSEKELEESMKEFNEMEEKRIAEEKANVTSMEFDKLEHDFGSIPPDSDNKCSFKVTNTGSKPLIIENVKASCGCTTPRKPEKPIPPGKSDFIEVGFHPNPGTTSVTKTITVTANTIETTVELKIKAEVKS